MSGMVLDDGTVLNVFGEGGGEQVAERLSALTDTDNVALLGSVPLDPQLRQHGDEGTPVVISNPDSPAARAIAEIAAKLKTRRTSLVGKGLGVNPR